MESIMAEKTGGKVLVLTDLAKEELFSNLTFTDDKVQVHPFSAAQDVVQDCQVDLILLDCNVDVDQGLKILKENKMSCPNIPNIFITDADVGLEGVVLKAFRAGARDFFRKPVNISELRHTVEGLLSIKKSCREKRSPFIKSAD
jgi:DNA-binding response OmpR family regulator